MDGAEIKRFPPPAVWRARRFCDGGIALTVAALGVVACSIEGLVAQWSDSTWTGQK
ncbi:MAG: hypothetical protein J6C93_01480 [Clostridia bacterium]|nr:hypothetical protein [Clostridia bacterium]